MGLRTYQRVGVAFGLVLFVLAAAALLAHRQLGEVLDPAALGRARLLVALAFLAAGAIAVAITSFVRRDSARRARLTAELKSSEERLQDFLDNATDLIHSTGPDGRILYANRAWREALGYDDEDLRELSLPLLLAPDARAKGMERFRDCLAGHPQTDIETVFISKDGRRVMVAGGASCRIVDGKPVSTRAIFRDITERRVNDAEHRMLEERMKRFVEHTPAAVAMVDHDLRYLLASRRWLADFHLGDRDIIGESHYELFPALPAHWRETYERCLAGGTMKGEDDDFARPDGTSEAVRWEVLPWHDASGRIGGLLMFAEVITDDVRARRALQESEARVRGVIDVLSEGVAVILRGGTIQSANASAERILGIKAETAVGRSLSDLPWVAVREDGTPFPRTQHPAFVSLETGRPQHDVVMGVRRRDGHEMRWVSVNSEPIRRNGDTAPFAVVCSFRDVTDRLTMEHDLRMSKEAAELVSRSQSQTMSLLARRLRPPLDGALALSVALIEKAGGRFSAEELMALERLRAQCRETLGAVDALTAAEGEPKLERRDERGAVRV